MLVLTKRDFKYLAWSHIRSRKALRQLPAQQYLCSQAINWHHCQTEPHQDTWIDFVPFPPETLKRGIRKQLNLMTRLSSVWNEVYRLSIQRSRPKAKFHDEYLSAIAYISMCDIRTSCICPIIDVVASIVNMIFVDIAPLQLMLYVCCLRVGEILGGISSWHDYILKLRGMIPDGPASMQKCLDVSCT